MGNISASLA